MSTESHDMYEVYADGGVDWDILVLSDIVLKSLQYLMQPYIKTSKLKQGSEISRSLIEYYAPITEKLSNRETETSAKVLTV